MPYSKVVISKAFGDENDLGKPTTFIGVMKKDTYGIPIWTDNRREIVLAFGRRVSEGKFYIGEIRKKNGEWLWVWGVPLEDIYGYEDLVKHIKESGN